MKTSKPVALSCRAVRAWRSIVSESAVDRGLGARHVAHCADCQRFFAGEASLEHALRHDALRRAEPAPAGLEQAILRSVRATSPVRPAARKSAPIFPYLLAGAAAAVVAGAVFLQTRPAEPPQGPTVAVTTPTPRATVQVASPTASQPVVLSELAVPVKQAIAESSLQSEVDSVYADARKAMRFLAVNFVPGAASQTTGSNARSDG
jgi:hypothetical protein